MALTTRLLTIFAASADLAMEDTNQYCTLNTPLNLSTHDPISTAINIENDKPTQESKYSDTYTEFKRQKIVWDSNRVPQYQQLAEKALTDAISY